jgi:hypothetical protein
MRPRFVDQKALYIPRPGWQKQKGTKGEAPSVIVVTYIDSDGLPWIYDEDMGLRRILVPGYDYDTTQPK